ncbi:MAG: sulfopyruvate decarboxylase [Thermodesulfobacteriota bacterium]
MMSKETAQIVLAGLKEAGIDLVVSLPDTALKELNQLVMDDPDLPYVPVCNEGDGIAICGGAWLGGKRPVMLMENCGLSLGAYALRRSAITFGFPMLLMMSYRGEFSEARWFSVIEGWGIEPLLQALRIRYTVVSKAAEIKEAIAKVQVSLSSMQLPAAILLGGETIW